MCDDHAERISVELELPSGIYRLARVQLGMEQRSQSIAGLYTLIKKTHMENGETEIQVHKEGSFLGLTMTVTTEFADKILVGDKVQVGEDLEVHLP